MYTFSHIHDDAEFLRSYCLDLNEQTYGESLSDNIFVPFELNEDDTRLVPDVDVDPDFCFLNQCSLQSNTNVTITLEMDFPNIQPIS